MDLKGNCVINFPFLKPFLIENDGFRVYAHNVKHLVLVIFRFPLISNSLWLRTNVNNDVISDSLCDAAV